MRTPRFISAMAIVMLGFAGCSASDTKDESSTDAAGLPLDQLEHGLAHAYCAALDHCDLEDVSTWVWALVNAGECDDAFARVLWGEESLRFARLHRAVSSGLVSYDPVAAARCVAELESLCPSRIDHADSWCQEAFGGDLAGACISTSTWSPNPDCPESLEPSAHPGWRSPAGEGESCCDVPCGAGLRCVYEPGATPEEDLSLCLARTALGSSGCSPGGTTQGDCEVGGVCSADGVCQPIPGADVEEILQGFTSDHSAGSACESGDWFRQGLCDPGLFCLSETQSCGVPKPAGATCGSSRECESGRCDPIGDPLSPDSLQCSDPTICGF